MYTKKGGVTMADTNNEHMGKVGAVIAGAALGAAGVAVAMTMTDKTKKKELEKKVSKLKSTASSRLDDMRERTYDMLETAQQRLEQKSHQAQNRIQEKPSGNSLKKHV